MQSTRQLKRIKLVLLAIIGLGYAFLPRHTIGSSLSQQEDRSRFEIVGQDTPLNDRFGSDDGAAFILHFTGDIHGTLEPCG